VIYEINVTLFLFIKILNMAFNCKLLWFSKCQFNWRFFNFICQKFEIDWFAMRFRVARRYIIVVSVSVMFVLLMLVWSKHENKIATNPTNVTREEPSVLLNRLMHDKPDVEKQQYVKQVHNTPFLSRGERQREIRYRPGHGNDQISNDHSS
jgi:hypothetical protein